MTGPYVSSGLLPGLPLWDRLGEKRVPLSFDLEVTARCNNDCGHCYINRPAGDREARAREMSLGEIAGIADQAVSLGSLWCLLTGGEPLLRDDFADVYMALKRKGLLVSVFTNACLVTEGHVRLFREYPPRDVEVTLYGATEATYEKVTRKPGSYAAFRRGLDLLLDGGVKVRLKAMALRSNVRELPAMAAFCRARTADSFRFDPLLHLRFDGDARRNEEIRAERLSPDEIVAAEQADAGRADALKKDCRDLVGDGFAHRECGCLFHCGAGRFSFNVADDGRFSLCSSLRHPECVYDLRNGTLAEAWNDFAPKVLGMRSRDREFLEKCRPCPIVNLCLWCPAHAHLETGRLDAWCEEFCRAAHARAAAISGPPAGTAATR